MSTVDDDFGDDFVPADPVAHTLDLLVRGHSRRDIADGLGVPLATVHHYVGDGVRRRAGESGTPREVMALMHASLDDVQRRAYEELARDVDSVAPLLEVVLGVQRLRAGLLAAATPPRTRE